VREDQNEQPVTHHSVAHSITDHHPELFTKYLFCININTKYLIVFPLLSKSAPNIVQALTELVDEVTVKHLRGDKEPAFRSQLMSNFLRAHHITSYWTDAPFTNHNRVVDRLIKGFRLRFAYHEGDMANYDILQKVVKEYNNTPHQAYRNLYTPLEVESNINIEGAYIRHEKKILELVEMRQWMLGYRGPHGYRPGNILLLHMDFGRTDQKNLKTHGIWYNGIGIFLKFVNRNVQVWHLAPSAYTPNPILISLSFTKRLSHNWIELPLNYAEFFNIPIQDKDVFLGVRQTIMNKTGILIPIPEPFPQLPPPPISDAQLLEESALQHQREEQEREEERLRDEQILEREQRINDLQFDNHDEDDYWLGLLDFHLARNQEYLNHLAEPRAEEPVVVSDDEDEADAPQPKAKPKRETKPIQRPLKPKPKPKPKPKLLPKPKPKPKPQPTVTPKPLPKPKPKPTVSSFYGPVNISWKPKK
jgi:hypothetical protein